jgi:hypothetical protein
MKRSQSDHLANLPFNKENSTPHETD